MSLWEHLPLLPVQTVTMKQQREIVLRTRSLRDLTGRQAVQSRYL